MPSSAPLVALGIIPILSTGDNQEIITPKANGGTGEYRSFSVPGTHWLPLILADGRHQEAQRLCPELTWDTCPAWRFIVRVKVMVQSFQSSDLGRRGLFYNRNIIPFPGKIAK